MFKNYLCFTILFAVLLLAGCSKDLNLSQDAYSVELTEIQASMDEIANEIEIFQQSLENQEEVGSRAIVHVPANSEDAIMAAIDEAGPGGTVILESGWHYESEPLVIDQPVKLKGASGAILEVNVSEQNPAVFPWPVNPAIYLKDSGFSRIEGIDLRPKNGTGSAALLLENAASARIIDNTFNGFFNGIFVYHSNGVKISGNQLEGYASSIWGITVVDGNHISILDNLVEKYAVGIYASDKKGVIKNNVTNNCSTGILLCTVPAWITHPNGNPMQAPDHANHWLVRDNESYNNTWGILVIDGAYKNFVYQNAAGNNGLYDIECTGETNRFGILTPTTKMNRVVSVGPYNNLIIKDCGVKNKIIGGQLVNNNEDPCF